jgi:hypothetical protein
MIMERLPRSGGGDDARIRGPAFVAGAMIGIGRAASKAASRQS